MTTLTAIVAAVVVALTADLGTFDLSATDQVQEGTFVAPPVSGIPFACVLPAELVGSEQQCACVYYLETYRIPVRLWAPVTASTTEDRVTRGRLLQAEAQAALDGARSTLGNAAWKCIRWAVVSAVPTPAAASAPTGWAYVELTIDLTYRRGAGTGA